MNQSHFDIEDMLEIDDVLSALRDDLPSDEDDRRMRLRLAGSMGSLLGTGLLLTQSSVGASTTGSTGVTGLAGSGLGAAVGTGSVPAAGDAVGLFAQLATLSTGAKALLVTAALSASVGVPAAVYLSPSSMDSAAPQKAAAPLAATGPLNATAPQKTAAPLETAKPTTVSSTQVDPSNVTTPAKRIYSVPSKAAVPSKAEPDKLTPAHAPGESASTVSAQTSVPTGELHEETLLLERALRAVASGEEQDALKWLDLHEKRFPVGALATERERTRARLAH